MAFGYRIDYSGRSVVLSGDTRISENLIGHAQNVHLLIHEVFARTKPKLAVYSPIVLPNATEQDLLPPTRKTYSGPLELGEDLMVIEVSEKIEVRRPPSLDPSLNLVKLANRRSLAQGGGVVAGRNTLATIAGCNVQYLLPPAGGRRQSTCTVSRPPSTTSFSAMPAWVRFRQISLTRRLRKSHVRSR